ncbi:MAG: recombination-associated protein RdgC [bacterium]
MWFKNLVVYQFEEHPDIDQNALEQGLDRRRFKPCGPQELETLGWTSPMGDLSEQLFHMGAGMTLLTARREERILPATVIREAVNKKVQEIEKKQDRKIGRKQKLDIRDQLTFEMMPRAFTRGTLIQGLVMPEQKLLVVDCASRNRAEQWTSLLRQSLGSLPVKPLSLNRSPSNQFTGWLGNNAKLPAGIALGDECVLQSPDDQGAVIRCRRQDLSGTEIREHLRAGKVVTQLALEWKHATSFVINEDADIKRLRFSDTLVEQAEADGVEDPAAEFDARFALMGLELSRFLPGLWDALGGLAAD